MHILLASACGLGCGSANAMPDDSLYFGVGVEPDAEMDAVLTTLRAHGFVEGRRTDTPRFIAVDLHSAEGSAVRIVSARGVVFALDAGTAEGLLSLDARTGSDLDGDTFADVIIVRTEAHRACLALGRVDAEGYFSAVRTDTGHLDGATCIEEFRDVNHDGRIDALVPMRAAALGVEATITVPLVLAENGTFAFDTEAVTAFISDERARRDALVMRAVDAADQAVLVRLACELAWLERMALTDEDTTRVARAFDTTVAHLPLSSTLSVVAQDARARLLQLDTPLGATASVND